MRPRGRRTRGRGRFGRLTVVCLLAAGLSWTWPVAASELPPPVAEAAQAASEAPAGAPALELGSPPDEVRQRARRILDAPGYQTEMPDLADLPNLPELPSFRGWGPLLQALQIAALVALVALLVYAVVDFLGVRRPAPTPVASPLPAAPRAAPALAAPPPLPDPEALAAAGRYGDAVHALLLHALVAIARHRRQPVPTSWTSREVLRGVELAAERRGALAELVSAVERYLFAGLPVGADEWERCRVAYRDLAAGGEAT